MAAACIDGTFAGDGIGGKMKGIYCVFLFGVLMSGAAMAVADCVNETYTITYSCGAGTVNTDAGKVLPEPQTAVYGQNVTTQSMCANDRIRNLNNLTCVAPDGMAWGGYAIYVDGKKVSTHTTNGAFTFKYLFNSDIEIQPNWVGPASLEDLRVGTGSAQTGGYNFNYVLGWTFDTVGDGVVGTWRTYYGFGYVDGDALCSSYRESDWQTEGAPVFIPNKQDLVGDDRVEDYWGYNCYCRIASENISFRPWVFRSATSSAGCDNNCESMCADYFTGFELFRSVVLTGLYEDGPTE